MNPQDIPESVLKWLNELDRDSASARETAWLEWLKGKRSPDIPPEDLRKRAAQCYAMAGWGDDACRMFELLGDRRRAAPYYEQRGLWLAAADCYAAVAEWQNAARCYRLGDRYDDAGECLLRADRPIQAAWVWADLAGLYQRATHTVQSLEVGEVTEQLAVELILARCEAGTGTSGAGRRLREAIVQLVEIPFDFRVQELKQWAFAVASELQRPDLTMMLYAIGLEAKHPGAATQWEEWLATRMGTGGLLNLSTRQEDSD